MSSFLVNIPSVSKLALNTRDTGGAELLENSLYVRNQYGNVTDEILETDAPSRLFLSVTNHITTRKQSTICPPVL